MNDTSSQRRCPYAGGVSTTVPTTAFFNPFDPQFYENPYPHYARLREQDPLHRSDFGVWFASRYDDVREILKSRSVGTPDIPAGLRAKNKILKTLRVSAAQPDNLDSLVYHADFWFGLVEGETHARLRNIARRALEHPSSQTFRQICRDAAQSLIAEARPQGRMDLMADFAARIPIATLAATLGISSDAAARIPEWTRLIMKIIGPLVSLEEYGRINEASAGLIHLVTDLIAQRRLRPGEDFVSALIESRDVDHALTERELVSSIILLLASSLETSTAIIANSIIVLLRAPHLAAGLRGQPDLMPAAVDEFLRYDCPVQMTSRVALEDLEVSGRSIRKGSQIYVLLASGNRDPARFHNPDEIDFHRARNHHLAFAAGPHTCLGMGLGRLMAQEALRVYLEMLPTAAAAYERASYRHNTLIRYPTQIPITF